MISYWRVLGTCCANKDFYDSVRATIDPDYRANPAAIPEKLYKFLVAGNTVEKFPVSLGEVWELARFFSPDPKGPGTATIVFDSMDTLHNMISGLRGVTFSQTAREILGLCCVDRDFTKALVDNANNNNIQAYLKGAAYQPSAEDLDSLQSLVTQPGFVATMGAMVMSVWNEPCDQSRTFNPQFADRNPWGSPGAWANPRRS